MERKINDTFFDGEVELKVVKRKNCKKCFYDSKDCDDNQDVSGECWSGLRTDETDVIFVEQTKTE